MKISNEKTMLSDHERRIKILEGKLPKQKKQESQRAYKGLSGGIRFLIDNNFFNEPKKASNVMAELKREGYHHSLAPISKMLSVNYTKSKKILNRIKENNVWKYMLRK
jgi:hypothetical protein